MNKYWNLIKNVVVLGVGSFTSKLLSVVMLPFYTHVLSEEEYGIADLVVNTANLLIPLVSLSIAEAVVRFALESKSYRKDALSIGILTVFSGFAVLLLCYPLMALNTKVSDYIWLIYLYVLMGGVKRHGGPVCPVYWICTSFCLFRISEHCFAGDFQPYFFY